MSELIIEFSAPEIEIEPGHEVVRDLVERDPYEGRYEVTPSESEQVLETEGLRMTDDVTVEGIPGDYVGSEIPRRDADDLTASGPTVTAPAGYYADPAAKSVAAGSAATPATEISADPTITVSAGGLIRAVVSKEQTVTPAVTPGYVDQGTPGEISIDGSAEVQLPMQAGKTVTPSESEQTAVGSGKFVAGDVKVAPISGSYVGSQIPRRAAADLSANGPTVTAPAGYYAEPAAKSVAAGSAATPATEISADPELTLDEQTGAVSAEVSESENVTPQVTPGYVDQGTPGAILVAGRKTLQLPTKAAEIFIPSKAAAQIIPAGKFLLGPQTIEKIPDNYYDMSDPMSFLGKEVEVIDTDFYSRVDTLDNTPFASWTPSSTAVAAAPAVTLSDKKFTAEDLDNYQYYIEWHCGLDPVYTGSPTKKALPLMARCCLIQEIGRRAGSMASIQSETFNYNVNMNWPAYSFLQYYGTTTGTSTFTWAASYGFYFGYTAPTISSTSADSPTITPKTPTMSARTSTTYMSATNAGLVDQANTKFWILGKKIYRIKRNGVLANFYRKQVEVINETPPSLTV